MLYGSGFKLPGGGVQTTALKLMWVLISRRKERDVVINVGGIRISINCSDLWETSGHCVNDGNKRPQRKQGRLRQEDRQEKHFKHKKGRKTDTQRVYMHISE